MAIFGATCLLVGPTYAAEARPAAVTRTPIDAESCQAINDGLRAAEASGKFTSKFSSEVSAQVARLTPADCFLEMIAKDDPTAAFGVASAAAATTCGYKHRIMNVVSGPIQVATVNFNAYFCWNGTRVWWQDYKNCWVSTF